MNKISITDTNDPRVSSYVSLNENQLKQINAPGQGVFVCESEKVIRRALAAGYVAESYYIEESKAEIIEELTGGNDDIPVYASTGNVMLKITGFGLTGGILSIMRRRPLPSADSLLSKASKVVLLDDIENPTNVGAIFRSAAAMGADAVLLSEGCSDPLYRRAARVSMGTVFQVPFTFVTPENIKNAKNSGFSITGLALDDNAVSIDDPVLKTGEKHIIVLGNENSGISKATLAMCDHTAMIPMAGDVDSLNVAAASAVGFWEIWKTKKRP